METTGVGVVTSHWVQTVVLVRVMVLVWVTGTVQVEEPEVTVDEVTE